MNAVTGQVPETGKFKFTKNFSHRFSPAEGDGVSLGYPQGEEGRGAQRALLRPVKLALTATLELHDSHFRFRVFA
jgi:hypothetical protein